MRKDGLRPGWVRAFIKGLRMKCPTCGQPKRRHDAWLWNAHQNMHKAHKKANREVEQLVKKYPLHHTGRFQ